MSEASARHLQHLVEAGERIQGLLDDVLIYARVRRDGAPFAPTDMQEVVAEALTARDPELRAIGARVEVGELPVVPADSAQMRALVGHLLENAIKFQGDEPLAMVIDAARADAVWRFSVRDNGIGIDKRHHGRVFTIFKRLPVRGARSASRWTPTCRSHPKRRRGAHETHTKADDPARRGQRDRR